MQICHEGIILLLNSILKIAEQAFENLQYSVSLSQIGVPLIPEGMINLIFSFQWMLAILKTKTVRCQFSLDKLYKGESIYLE